MAAPGGETNNKLVEVNKEGRRGGLIRRAKKKAPFEKHICQLQQEGCVGLGLWDGLIGRVQLLLVGPKFF